MPDEITTEEPQTPSSDAAPQETPSQEQQDAAVPSAREAVERAIAKVNEEPKSEAVEPSQEAAPEGEPKAEPKPEGEQPRGPDGKFKSKPKEGGDGEPESEGKPAEPPKVEPEETPPEVGEPPQRFAKAAQEAWKDTPEPVRAEITRAITEMESGIAQYKEVADAFEPIIPYVEMAQQGGTTLEDALQAYTGMENMLRQNPLQGLAAICQNLNIDPRKAGEALAGMREMPAAPQAQQPPQLPPEFQNLAKQVSDLQTSIGQQQAEGKIREFANSHPYFSELENDIAELMESGYCKTLDDAYDKAKRLNPVVAAKIEADKAAKAAPKTPSPDPAQTREKAALSPTGSPAPGSEPAAMEPAKSPRQALERAFARV